MFELGSDAAKNARQKHIELVRLLVGGDQHIHHIAAVLVYLCLGVELAIVSLIPEELKVALPLEEGSENPVLPLKVFFPPPMTLYQPLKAPFDVFPLTVTSVSRSWSAEPITSNVDLRRLLEGR